MAKLIGLASTKGDNVDSLCPSRILPNAFFLRERYETSFARPRAAASALSYTGVRLRGRTMGMPQSLRSS
jgi:hypothetical protein